MPIETLEEPCTPERLIQITIWEAGDYYNFIIWNNGLAIPEEQQERVFAAGYSTKNSSGLGLSIVKELVEELRGQVSVYSNPTHGTEFKIVIPKTATNNLPLEQPGNSSEIDPKLFKN